jgi:hypothetical protein
MATIRAVAAAAFLLAGRPLALAPDNATFPKFAARSGDTITVQAWAIDDEAEGPRAAATFSIVNTAPPASMTEAVSRIGPVNTPEATGDPT